MKDIARLNQSQAQTDTRDRYNSKATNRTLTIGEEVLLGLITSRMQKNGWGMAWAVHSDRPGVASYLSDAGEEKVSQEGPHQHVETVEASSVSIPSGMHGIYDGLIISMGDNEGSQTLDAYQLAMQSCRFLGHVVGQGWAQLEQAKVDTAQQFCRPPTKKTYGCCYQCII